MVVSPRALITEARVINGGKDDSVVDVGRVVVVGDHIPPGSPWRGGWRVRVERNAKVTIMKILEDYGSADAERASRCGIADEGVLLTAWAELRVYRSAVLKKLEEARAAGVIGSSLQAEIEIRATCRKHESLAGLGDDLRFVLITSRAALVKVSAQDDESILVAPSRHTKCERCWHYRADVGMDPARPELCGRCVSNLDGPGERRNYA